MKSAAFFVAVSCAPLLVACGAPITGSISARAVPVPVMVGQKPSGAAQREFRASGELDAVSKASSTSSGYNWSSTLTITEKLRRSSLVFAWILMKGRLQDAAGLSQTEALWIPQIGFTRLDTESESHSFGESSKRKTSSLSVVVSAMSSEPGALGDSAAAAPSEQAPR